MNEIDKKIREALQVQDADLYAEFGEEQSLHEMVIDSFRGKSRWLVLLTFGATAVFFMPLMILSAVQFFKVDTTREMIAYAIGFVFCMTGIAMMKMWYWMELQKNAITREVKRIELQLARISQRLQRD